MQSIAIGGWLLALVGCSGSPSDGSDAGTVDGSPVDGSPADSSSADGSSDSCPVPSFAEPGQYTAGVTRLNPEDLPVEVWYPAPPQAAEGAMKDRYDMRTWLPSDAREKIPEDAPTRFTTDAYRDVDASDDGPFPVVLFSHGLAGYRMQSSFLTTHLATHGFVVVAPEHPERNLAAVLNEDELTDESPAQLRLGLEAVTNTSSQEQGVLQGVVDPERVAVTGHSAGGGAVKALVEGDQVEIAGWLGMASLAAPQERSPGLMLGGTRDELATPEMLQNSYAEIPHSDKRLVSIARAGHLSFTDICTIGQEQGGVLQIAQDSGVEVSDLVVRLGSDGCGEMDLRPQRAWPLIRHYATAHLRAVLLGEQTEPSLGSQSIGCFGDRVEQLEMATEE